MPGAKRSPQLPDVPTFADAGLPAVESYAWYGFFAPAKTPKDIVTKLNAEKTPKFMNGHRPAKPPPNAWPNR